MPQHHSGSTHPNQSCLHPLIILTHQLCTVHIFSSGSRISMCMNYNVQTVPLGLLRRTVSCPLAESLTLKIISILLPGNITVVKGVDLTFMGGVKSFSQLFLLIYGLPFQQHCHIEQAFQTRLSLSFMLETSARWAVMGCY